MSVYEKLEGDLFYLYLYIYIYIYAGLNSEFNYG